MSRVSDALRRAAEELHTESAAKLHDPSAIDVVEPFPAEVPVENPAVKGQKLTGGKSSPPLLLAASHDGALHGSGHLGSNRPTPVVGGTGHAAPSDALSHNSRAASDLRAVAADVRKKRSGSFEDLIRDIARDEQRMNL